MYTHHTNGWIKYKILAACHEAYSPPQPTAPQTPFGFECDLHNSLAAFDTQVVDVQLAFDMQCQTQNTMIRA